MSVTWVLALITLAVALALGALLVESTDRADGRVCVSAVGPVDANGNGQTTPVEAGDCP